MSKLQVSVAILLLCLLTISSATSSVLKSKVKATLLDARSSIPVSKFQTYGSLMDAVSTSVQGSFHARVVEGVGYKLAGSGFENFYPPFPEVYPQAVIYDISQDSLIETDRIYGPVGVACTNALFSDDPENLFIATSTFKPSGPIISMYVPQDFPINMYRYYVNGTIDKTPVYTFDMSTLHPEFYNKSAAYTGLAAISKDSKYLMATYALGVNFPFITGQKMTLLKVESDLSLTVAATIDHRPSGIAGFQSFPQGLEMVRLDNSTKYLLFSAENSWNLFNPLGLTAQVATYMFDSADNSLVVVDTDWVSQYMQGYAVDTVNKLFYTFSNEVSSDGISTHQFARSPYNNPSTDKDSELRVWGYEDDGTLTYLGGVDMGVDGIQVRPSNNGDLLALTYNPIIGTDIFLTNFTSLGPYSRRYTPTTLAFFEVTKKTGEPLKLTLESLSGAAPLSFGLAFDAADEYFTIFGQSTYRFTPGVGAAMTAGQKDAALYKIDMMLSKHNKSSEQFFE